MQINKASWAKMTSPGG